jgi:hypothetical protein
MGISTLVEEIGVVPDEVSETATFKLLDLPNELLFLIVEDLDNETLLNLGLTCRQMNFIALDHFFVINNIRDPRRGWFSPCRNPPPPLETLAVLRSALFVKHLRSFDFAVSSGIERMRNEVLDIHALVTRLSLMEVFKISFHRSDNAWLSLNRTNCLPIDPWYRSITNLLDAVLERGCTKLRVAGGIYFSDLYSVHTPLQKLTESTQSEGTAGSIL